MPTSEPLLHSPAQAYPRWKLDDFGDNPRAGQGSLPTVRQIEALREQARQEGYAAGHGEGLAAGRAQARDELARLDALMARLDAELAGFDTVLSERLVTLALDMARQLVRDSLARNPRQVVAVVQDAMHALPPFGEHAQLMVHPEDAALVRATLGDQIGHSKWKLLEDGGIERGGCRVQTSSMLVDATLATRWQRMAATLARNDAWHREDAPGAEEAQ